ncbi:MAG: putative cytochrome P450 135B1 [Actinomycetes bacterium]|nr:MAG: putative cytochrome P450 135B1 [Actinomycetes bacterium]
MAPTGELPPGPRAPSAWQSFAWQTRPIPYLERCRARYGKTFTLDFLGIDPFVMMSRPGDIKAIFTAPPDVLHSGEGSAVLLPVVGPNSILLLDEDRHLAQRKLMLPAFHGEKMEALRGVVTDVARSEVDGWTTGAAVPLHPYMQGLTLEVILRAIFGLDRGARLERLRKLVGEMTRFAMSPISLIPPLQRLGRLLPPVGAFLAARERADEEIQGLIDERRADPADRDDVLSLLLLARHEDGAPMSNTELRDELMTLLVAGHETTATELSWAFERLLRHPEALDRLVAEVDAGEDAYVTAAIRETLRRRPVLSIAGPRRVVSEIEVGGRTYGPGCHLVPNAYLVHHDAEIYPEPYAFRPERYLDEDPGTYTWIPFGGGRRRCLGASFAMLEMDIVLRAVLSRMEVRIGGDGHLEANRRRMITVVPARGAEAVLSQRGRAPVPA